MTPENALRIREMIGARALFPFGLCYYLKQTAQIRAYLDELTLVADNTERNGATADVRSLLILPES